MYINVRYVILNIMHIDVNFRLVLEKNLVLEIIDVGTKYRSKIYWHVDCFSFQNIEERKRKFVTYGKTKKRKDNFLAKPITHYYEIHYYEIK